MDSSKCKVVGLKEVACSRTISSHGRDNTVVLMNANTAGNKTLNIWDQWMAPPGRGLPGTMHAASKKEWMDSKIFFNFILQKH